MKQVASFAVENNISTVNTDEQSSANPKNDGNFQELNAS